MVCSNNEIRAAYSSEWSVEILCGNNFHQASIHCSMHWKQGYLSTSKAVVSIHNYSWIFINIYIQQNNIGRSSSRATSDNEDGIMITLVFHQCYNSYQNVTFGFYIDGLVQERCNFSALAMELRLPHTNPSILSGSHKTGQNTLGFYNTASCSSTSCLY